DALLDARAHEGSDRALRRGRRGRRAPSKGGFSGKASRSHPLRRKRRPGEAGLLSGEIGLSQMKSSSRAAAVLLATFRLWVAPLFAHDFWIEPSTFRPSVPSRLNVALRVGQDFRGDPVPRDDRKIERFVLSGATGESSIPGLPGTDPAGFA